jgi:outer membrane protein assembly factor BamB
VRAAGGRSQDVTRAIQRGAPALGKVDVLLLASFSLSDAEVRLGLGRARAAVAGWVAGGGTLVVLAQEGRDTAALGPWLPDGLSVQWGDRDGPGLRPVVAGHPLLAGLAAGADGLVPTGRYAPSGGDKSVLLSGVHDALRQSGGFRTIAAVGADGSSPALVVGAHGQGRVVVLAAAVDRFARDPATAGDGAAARRLLAGILDYAATVRAGRAPAEPPTPWVALPVPRTVTVFLDADGNGRRDAGEAPLAGVRVGHGRERHVTGADGTLVLAVDPANPRWVHVQKPGELRWGSGPPWRRDDAAEELAFPLVERRTAGHSFTLLHVTDTHVGLPYLSDDDVAGLFAGAARMAPPVDFVLVTGDLTQRGTEDEIGRWARLAAAAPLPVLSARGNHDAGRSPDRGPFYDQLVGPLFYGFDHDDVHVTVTYVTEPDTPEWEWVRTDIRESGRPTVLALHHLPRTELLETLDGLPLAAVLHGHWHGNRVVPYGPRGVPVVATSTARMGGWDHSPASVRTLTFQGGRLSASDLRYPGGERLLHVAAPAEGEATAAETLVVHAHDPWRPPQTGSVSAARVGATADEDPWERPLRPLGALTWTADLAELPPGEWTVRVTVADAVAAWPTVARTFRRVAPGPAPASDGAWPTFRGDLRRSGSAAGRPRLPLALRWAAALGGAVHHGGPVADGERVYVPLEDRTSVDAGAARLVALDRRDGRPVWTYDTASSVRHSPAVSGGLVVAQEEDGTVTALRAEDGQVVWRHDLSERYPPAYVKHWASCAPILGRQFVVACYHSRPLVLDRRDGRRLAALDRQGREDAFTTSSAALAASGGETVLYHGGLAGLTAYELRPDGTARRRWRQPGLTLYTTPLARDGQVLVQATGGLRWLTAADGSPRADGAVRGAAAPASPLLTSDRVLTVDRAGALTAFDPVRGRVLWRTPTEPAPLSQAVNAPPGTPSVSSAPALAGGVLFVGADDGHLRAVRASDGAVLWDRDLGLPVTGGPAIAGRDVYVADMDGVVYAFR